MWQCQWLIELSSPREIAYRYPRRLPACDLLDLYLEPGQKEAVKAVSFGTDLTRFFLPLLPFHIFLYSLHGETHFFPGGMLLSGRILRTSSRLGGKWPRPLFEYSKLFLLVSIDVMRYDWFLRLRVVLRGNRPQLNSEHYDNSQLYELSWIDLDQLHLRPAGSNAPCLTSRKVGVVPKKLLNNANNKVSTSNSSAD